MNKEEKKLALSGAEGIVPELRFPEFGQAGDWDEKRLDEVAKVVTGSTPKTADLENYGGDKLFVSPADISDGRYIDKTIKTLSEKGFSQSRVIPKNSILFVCIGSTIGKLAQNKIECTTNQQINSLIPFKSTSNDFIYSLLEKNAAYIASLAAQQAVPLINKSDFSAVKFYYPKNPKEQQKIAACLSSLDEVITAETEKLELLQDHKKGLLQQLFPQEGDVTLSGVEGQPKFRFPEFKEDGDWQETTIGKLGGIVTGKTPSTKDESLWNGEILFITPTDISEDKYQKTTNRSVSRTDKMKILPIGSIVYTCIASIGKIAITTKESITNQQINSVIPNKNIVSDFVYYLLVKLTPFIKSIPATSTLPIINKTEFSQIKCSIPNPKEQQKIAACLSAADDLIEAQIQKIEALQGHKKGLLQQLFPQLSEL